MLELSHGCVGSVPQTPASFQGHLKVDRSQKFILEHPANCLMCYFFFSVQIDHLEGGGLTNQRRVNREVLGVHHFPSPGRPPVGPCPSSESTEAGRAADSQRRPGGEQRSAFAQVASPVPPWHQLPCTAKERQHHAGPPPPTPTPWVLRRQAYSLHLPDP